MASVIVVDNDLKGSIEEYSSIIDGINESKEFSTSLNLPQEGDEINKKDIFQIIDKESTPELFKKLTDKEFEPTFYLLIHILSELSSRDNVLNNSNSSIYTKLREVIPSQPQPLKDRKSIKSTTILSIYSSIFNLLSSKSKTRTFILKEILHGIRISNIEFALIEKNFGNNLISWLKEAESDREEISDIFWSFIGLDSNYSKNSLYLLKSFTQSYGLTSAEELNKFILFAMKSKVVDLSFLINNNVAKYIETNTSNPLTRLFTKYIRGEMIIEDDFSGLNTDLPVQNIIKKSEILALSKYLSKNSNEKLAFDYKDIPNYTSSFELEALLVDAIKSGILEGKMNQVEEKFYLSRVNRFVVAGDENKEAWEDVKSALQKWEGSLNNINEIVKAARENIVNSSA